MAMRWPMGFVNFQVDSGQIALLFLLIHPSTGWFRPDVPEGCHKLYWVVSKQLSPQDIDQDVKNFLVMLTDTDTHLALFSKTDMAG